MRKLFQMPSPFKSLLLAGVALCAASSCRNQEGGSVPQIYYKAIYSKVLTFDPSRMTDTASLSVANQIYDGLLEFGPHFDLQPALAETWETSSDGKTLTFQLRKNVRFHDGTPLSPEDCVASFGRLLGPTSLVAKHYDLIEGVEARGPHTFVIRLKNKFPPFAAVLAGATAKILPKQLAQAKAFSSPVGTGPFKLLLNSDTQIVLGRFDNYWREPSKLEELRFIVGTEAEGIAAALKGELHDTVSYPLNGDEAIFTSGSGQHLQIPLVATWVIGLNTRLAPFNRKEVRQRFKAALSSEDFIKTFYTGQMPAAGYVPPGLSGYIVPTNAPQNPAPQVRKESTPITILIPIELAKSSAMKVYFEKRLSEAGFKTRFEPVRWNVLEKGFNNKSLQGFLMSMNADYPESSFLFRSFESNNVDNFSGLNSKEIDSLILRAKETDSRSDRATIYSSIAEKLEEEAVTVNLLHYRAHLWFAKCVQGIELNSLGDYYIPYRKISLSENCVTRRENEVASHVTK